ncbi:MAG: sigma 54-interacting transcriptional regulator [Magnetococcales bacterium]|nr:sigma 54-interacting transcriptional regulator [Magnetococcales bacterium]
MTIRTLIVDGDDAILEEVVPVLSKQGYQFTSAKSVRTATEVLRSQCFDLVLCDINLPDGSGIQLVKDVNEEHPDTSALIITDNIDSESVQAAIKDGVFNYLTKPVLPSHIKQIVHLTTEHKRLRKEQEMLKSRMEAIFRGVDDAIVAIDDKWRIIQFNEAATRLLGITPPALDQPLQEVMSWLFPFVEPLLRKARKEGAGKRSVRMVNMNEEGMNRILNCTASLFLDPAQDTQGMILVVRDESRLAMLERETKTRQGWHGLVGSSQPMQDIYQLIEHLSEVDSTVLVSGETGTGKELAARALHDTSPRASRAFVAVNCASLPVGLIESELFGHVRGAFTNAIRDKPGRFKLADGGSIFLDEIGDISLDMQIRLLRVLQEKVFEAVGDNNPIRVDVRVITATHRNLRELVQEGLFREDLYYRLKVVEMRMPPLREHKTDMPALIDHFLAKLNLRLNRSVRGVSDEALAALMDYDWPGNVRELEHVLEHAMVVAPQSILTWSNLPPEFRARTLPSLGPPPCATVTASTTSHGGRPLKRSYGPEEGESLDRETILRVLIESRWHMQIAAIKLNISRSTLWRRMKAMGLRQPEETT